MPCFEVLPLTSEAVSLKMVSGAETCRSRATNL